MPEHQVYDRPRYRQNKAKEHQYGCQCIECIFQDYLLARVIRFKCADHRVDNQQAQQDADDDVDQVSI